MMETQTARCRVDDIAGSVLPTENLFLVWVTLNEQKWISFVLLSADVLRFPNILEDRRDRFVCLLVV
jgi:hypothetical protein